MHVLCNVPYFLCLSALCLSTICNALCTHSHMTTMCSTGPRDTRRLRPPPPGPLASELDSVAELMLEVEGAEHAGLVRILREHTFVGMVGAAWRGLAEE